MKKGIVCICLSAFGFALMTMFVRLADTCGSPIPSIEKAFFRNIVAVLLAGAVFVRGGGRAAVFRTMPGAAWRDLVLRAFFGSAGIFLNFYAISHIPVADAMALNKTAPFFTLLLCWLLFGERMSFRQTVCVPGAFAGALLVVKPGFADGFSASAFVGLASGFCAGTAYAFLHRLGRRGVGGAAIILFFSLFSCVSCIPFVLLDFHPLNPAQVGSLCGAGAGAALGQFGITWAYRFAEPRQIAVYDYSGILFAAVLGFFAFGQIPDVWSLLGFAVIVAMALVVFRERVKGGA